MDTAKDTDNCDQWLSESLRALLNSAQARMGATLASRGDVDAMVQALYAGDLAKARQLMGGHREAHPHTGHTTSQSIASLILPAIYELERNWTSDARDYTQTLRAFWQLQTLLHDEVAPGRQALEPAPVRADARIILATAPGSEHTFGVQVVHAHFAARGWSPRLLLRTEVDVLKQALSDGHVDVLGLSVGHDAALAGLPQLISELRACSANPGLQIMVGGNVFNMADSEYEWIGADGLARSADEAFSFCQTHSRQRLQ